MIQDFTILAINMLIMKTAGSACGLEAKYFFKMFGIIRTQYDNLLRMVNPDSWEPGMEYTQNIMNTKWDYEKIAKANNIDMGVLTGDHMIEVNGEIVNYIRENFVDLVNNAKASEIAKGEVMQYGEIYMTELALWEAVMQYRDKERKNEFHKSYCLMKNEIRCLVKQNRVYDKELRNYVNFCRRYVEMTKIKK